MGVSTNGQICYGIAFCGEHGIEIPGEPRWYLSSMWG
jgi:hypothetical protein